MENIFYLVIEEAPVDYPSEVCRSYDEADAQRVADALSDAQPEVAYMVMTEAEYDEYQADFSG